MIAQSSKLHRAQNYTKLIFLSNFTNQSCSKKFYHNKCDLYYIILSSTKNQSCSKKCYHNMCDVFQFFCVTNFVILNYDTQNLKNNKNSTLNDVEKTVCPDRTTSLSLTTPILHPDSRYIPIKMNG